MQIFKDLNTSMLPLLKKGKKEDKKEEDIRLVWSTIPSDLLIPDSTVSYNS